MVLDVSGSGLGAYNYLPGHPISSLSHPVATRCDLGGYREIQMCLKIPSPLTLGFWGSVRHGRSRKHLHGGSLPGRTRKETPLGTELLLDTRQNVYATCSYDRAALLGTPGWPPNAAWSCADTSPGAQSTSITTPQCCHLISERHFPLQVAQEQIQMQLTTPTLKALFACFSFPVLGRARHMSSNFKPRKRVRLPVCIPTVPAHSPPFATSSAFPELVFSHAPATGIA